MKKLLISIIVLLIMISSTFLFAEEVNNSGEKEKTNEEKLEENLASQGRTKEEIAALKLNINSSISEVQRIQALIDEKNAEIEDLNSQSTDVQRDIANLENLLNMAGEEYNGQNEIFKTRIRGIYELGVLGFWDILFTSKDIPEFLEKYDIVTKLIKYDRDILASLTNKKGDLTETKRDLDVKRAALDKITKDKEKIAANLEQDKSKQNEVLNKLWSDKANVEYMLATMQDEETRIRDAILKEKEEEERRRKIEEAEFLWPVPGHYIITSPFGTRTDPITGTVTHHSGMDIGAPEGTEIIAADSGTVIRMMNDNGYNGGCGNYVIISHGTNIDGRQFSTRYMHMHSVIVKVGDKIEKGQLIGYVGKTGRVTGPHLDYSVLIDGVANDPLVYYTNLNK